MHQIAVEGCLHGELDAVYGLLLERERREGVKIDLLLCCGDFQVRVWGEGLGEGRDRGLSQVEPDVVHCQVQFFVLVGASLT